MIRALGTKLLRLFTRSHVCQSGPMAGAQIVLSEHSRSSAWLVIRGEVGRYVVNEQGRLEWEKR